MLIVAACGAAGQDLDDILGGDGSSDDGLLGAARKAVEEQKRKKAAAEAAAAVARARAEKEALERAEALKVASKHYDTVKHPRILVTPERLALIREQIKIPGSHFQLAHALMVRHSEGDPMKVWGGDSRKGYWPVYASRELAFLSLVAEDPAEKRRYAAMAAKVFPKLDYVRWFGFKSRSLGHAMATFGAALTYDWAYNEWTEQERREAEEVLEYLTGHWEKYRRVSEDPDEVSGYNFYGVMYGAQVMLHLAAGREKAGGRFPVCVDVLTRHLSHVGGELGASNEGMGYTEYPMGFALPAAMALAQHGEKRALEAAGTHAFWKLCMYADTFMTSYDRKFIQYGADHASNSNEGMASLQPALCPKDRLPGYLWFYDRHMGRLAKAEAERRFDCNRGNAVFALLLYPDGVTAADPTDAMPKAVMDSHGYIFFRNRWRDENDIMVALLNPVHRSGGWSQCEYLNLRLMAFDTRFFGGPAKTHDVENYTTLLVDGRNSHPAKEFVPGRIAAFEPAADGGYAIVDAGDYYRGLGATQTVRHLLVRYSGPDENSALISTLDLVGSDKQHVYTWQANIGPPGVFTKAAAPAGKAGAPGPSGKTAVKLPPLGAGTDAAASDGFSLDEPEEKKLDDPGGPAAKAPESGPEPSDDGIVSTQSMESGQPFFLLKGRNGYVKGWVLHPADAEVKTGDPLQITTKSANAKIWVVMYVGSGAPTEGVIEGTGMDTVLSVEGREVRFDGKRVRCK